MKKVLITGISKGIGYALATKFLNEGYEVIGTIKEGAIELSHQNLRTVILDLGSAQSINQAVALISKTGKMDLLINNAGVLLDEEEITVKKDLLSETLNINLIGTIDFTEQIIPILNEDAHILNISSMAGSLSDTDSNTTSHYPYHYPAYRISKCALNMYTRTLAMRFVHEMKPIKVSSIHPGWVKTDIGGNEAPVTPLQAAEDIYSLYMSQPESGFFWFKGNKIPW